jgi:hypothetical protein
MKKRWWIVIGIVVIVLILIFLGYFFVRPNICDHYYGVKYNVDQMNEKVKTEIAKLFQEERRVFVYLPNHLIGITQGSDWGVGIGIRNIIKGPNASSTFIYNIAVTDPCEEINDEIANSYIKNENRNEVIIAPGESYSDTVRLNIPLDAPTKCIIRYKVNVSVKESDGNLSNYASLMFK